MTDTLTVHRLRLPADRAAASPRLAARVEDALRIATRPPALAHAYVLIRRLRVTVPRDGASQGIALRLEREWARLLAQARPIAEASDATEIVWAADEVAGRQALLVRWLAGDTPRTWFWERLAAGAAAGATLPDRVAALLAAPWQDAAAGAAQSQRWWRVAMPLIARCGHADAVLARLPSTPRRQLLAAWQEAAVEAGAAALQMPELRSRPTRAAPAAAGLPAATAVNRVEHGASRNGSRRSPAPGHQRQGAFAAPPLPAAGPLPSAGRSPQPADAPADRDAPIEPARWPGVASAGRTLQPASVHGTARSDLRARPTTWAGLWFLLPLLRRSGYAGEGLGPRQAQSARDAARLVLLLEAAREAFGLDAVAGDWIDERRERSAAWLATGEVEPLRAEASCWWRCARLACLRDARMPLRRLLHRGGEVLAAPHRVDVVLPLHTLDIRIRRAGYDLDPGYMPWLDLVLRFHYA